MIEGLHGCEVISDDFLVVGYGENIEMGIQDHDRNLRAFLDRCDQRNLHLNVDKIQLRMTEVPFIGHTATANELYVADTLSRAYLLNESVPASVTAINEASSAENLAMSANRLKRLRTASRNDASLQHVAKLVEKGWPARHEVRDIAMSYYSVRSLLTIDNYLLFKDNQLVVPSSMRDEMMDCAHKSHGGIGACLRRMRECIFWPGM